MASNEWLVRKLHEQDKKIEALSRGGTGVGHTSIAPGENLTVISDNGEVVLGAGGVDHVDGPTPATPSAPTLKLGFGTIETTWDGTFAEGEDEDGVPLTAPVDFDVVEVHCSTDPEEEEWGEDTMRGQIKTREGGTITVGGFDVDDEVFVCLIALAKTGKRSAPSATASLVIEGLDFAQLTNELDAATVTIDNAREVLLDGQNTLGEKLDAADTALSDLETSLGELDSTTLPALRSDLDAAEGRLSTAEGQITDAFGELDAVPGQISAAKQAAIDAAESDATAKATAAQNAAQAHADLVAQGAEDDAIAAAEVRAQELADAAQDAAEAAAQVKADAARDEAIDAATAAMGGIPRPSYGRDVPTHGAPDGSVYFQTDPKALVSYGWAGSPHASESIKYVDGVEVARNLIPNPSLEGGITGWRARSTHQATVALSAFGPAIAVGSQAMYIQATSNAGNDCVAVSDPIPVNANSTYTVAASVRKSSGTGAISFRMYWYDSAGARISIDNAAVYRHNPSGSQNHLVNTRVSGQYASPPGAVSAEVGVWLTSATSDVPPAGSTVHVDAVSFVESSEAAPYFDGDTQDGVINVEDKVTAQWERRDGVWVQVPIRSEAIANLDVGKLTAGTATIAEAVVAKIAAQTASIQQADVGNLFVTGTSSLSDVVAERIAAETAKFIELEVGNLVAGTGTMDTATINKLFAEVVVARMSVAEQFIGENAILTGAVTAPKITASEELWAKIGEFVKIRAEHLEADAIDGMVITGATIRSAATGARTLMSATGFEAYNNAGKRTFFASASTGNVSMTGELYTGESGSERVVLDNSLWNSVAVVDPETGTQTNVPGAGVRIGVSSSSGADIYHGAAPASGGRYVDQAVFRGPSGRARTVYGSASAGGGFPASSHVLSIADDNSGVVAAECRVTSSGIGSATRKVELIGADANGRSRALIRASGGNGKSNMWGLDANGIETSEVAADGQNRSAWLGGKDSSGALTAYVSSFGNTGFTDISGSNQNPLNVNYTGTSDWWVVPFKKGGTSWGYVGSSGAMGVDDFGVQSAASKNLVLTTTTGSAGIIAKTNGDVTFSDSKGVNFSNIPVNNGTGVNVTAGGWFQKNTSSLRYKTDVETVDMSGFDVLSLEPKSFVYKDQKARFEKPRDEWGEYEEEIFANGLPTSYGLIAEEVEAAGGEFVVNYDQEGLPDSLNYGLIGVALIPEVRKLRDRITELERQLNE